MKDDGNVVTVELSESAEKHIGRLADKAADAVERATEANEETKKIHEQIKVLSQTWEANLKQAQETLKGGTYDHERMKGDVMKVVDECILNASARGLMNPNAQASLNRITDPHDAKGDYLNWSVRRGKGASVIDVLENAIRSKATGDTHRHFQRQSDDMVLLAMMANRLGSKNPVETIKTKMPNVWAKWLDYQAAYLAETKAALDPVDTVSESEWIPAPFSTELRERLMITARVPGMFRTIFYDGAGKTYTLPVDLTDVVPDFIPEVETYTNPYAAADPTQLGQTLSAANRVYTMAKHRVRFMVSGEFVEDSVVPALPLIRGKFVRTMVNGHEKVIIDGQKTANIDTGGGGPGTYDIRKASDGIRFFCSAGQANVLFNVGGDNILYSDIIATRALMGEYGVMPSDLAMIVGPSVFMQLLKVAEIVTADKFGTGAMVFTGAPAAIGGISVIPSRYVREDLNASGIYDAVTTTRTAFILVNVGAWLTVEKRRITAEEARLAPTDQWDLIAMRRLDFNQYLGNTQKVAAVGYNVLTAVS